MGSVPFSLYDFLGYLSAGALYLLAASHVTGGLWLSQENPSLALQVLWLLMAYLIGHVNAHWASWLLQAKVTRQLGAPSVSLFASQSKRPFKHYRSPLPQDTAKAILDKYERMTGSRKAGESMFLYCYHLVKEKCPQAYARLNAFLALYGFSRNMSFAALVLSASFAWLATQGHAGSWRLSGIAFVVALTLFFRFLKFFRVFSVEVFTSFLTSVPEEPGASASPPETEQEGQAKGPQ